MQNEARHTKQFKPALTGLLLTLALALTGCGGGTKLLKDPDPLVFTSSLADASDERLSATLDWVIVRDGPGTWAKNVDWDEYLIRLQNRSGESLQITSIILVDSLGTRIHTGESRRKLVKGTKKTKKRFKDEGLTVNAGAGAGTLLIAGAVTATTAMSVGAAAVYGGSALAGAAVTGLVLAPALAIGGIVRGVNNSKVSNEIESRQSLLPVDVQESGEIGLDLFFPLTPSPRQIEVTYVDSRGEHVLLVDTSDALEGLHLVRDTD